MVEEEHKHCYTFNDDGFQVCELCGLCSTLRDHHYQPYHETAQEPNSQYADVLINHNIVYVDQVEKKYKQIKSFLQRGYPNIVLYAYCTYNVLLEDGIYYSLGQISDMFQIQNFSKLFCHIEKNPKVAKQFFNVKTDQFVKSALDLFLCHSGFRQQQCKALAISNIIKKKRPGLKLNFLVAISLYFTLKNLFESKKRLYEELETYFSINVRTLKTHLKRVSKTFQI